MKLINCWKIDQLLSAMISIWVKKIISLSGLNTCKNKTENAQVARMDINVCALLRQSC